MQITPVSNALGANVSDVALDELTDDQAAQLVGDTGACAHQRNLRVRS